MGGGGEVGVREDSLEMRMVRDQAMIVVGIVERGNGDGVDLEVNMRDEGEDEMREW